MNSFFVAGSWQIGDEIVLGTTQAHQIYQMLHLRPQQNIILLDNRGLAYQMSLTHIHKREVRGRVTALFPASGEPTTHLTLYQGLLKADKFEWVLQKGTEVGVSRFVPVVTERTVVTEVSPNKQARWERILTEAAEQAGRGRVPELLAPLSFREALNSIPPTTLALIPWENETHTTLTAAATRAISTIALFIGPEGGWSASEIEAGRVGGCIPITLGRRILRAETAAVVAAALVLYQQGDMQ